tara:strand:+ start:876 stop:1067 length:192 start_codon:yes stop_codon:yes gene_type:complete
MLYQLLVGEFQISPSEYWSMTPAEVNSIVEAKRPKVVGGIHEDDFEAMMIRRQKLIDEGVKVL